MFTTQITYKLKNKNKGQRDRESPQSLAAMAVELRQGTLLSHKGVKNTTIGALILTSFQGLNEEAGVKSWSGLSN